MMTTRSEVRPDLFRTEVKCAACGDEYGVIYHMRPTPPANLSKVKCPGCRAKERGEER